MWDTTTGASTGASGTAPPSYGMRAMSMKEAMPRRRLKESLGGTDVPRWPLALLQVPQRQMPQRGMMGLKEGAAGRMPGAKLTTGLTGTVGVNRRSQTSPAFLFGGKRGVALSKGGIVRRGIKGGWCAAIEGRTFLEFSSSNGVRVVFKVEKDSTLECVIN